jgi:hypothetical protein
LQSLLLHFSVLRSPQTPNTIIADTTVEVVDIIIIIIIIAVAVEAGSLR